MTTASFIASVVIRQPDSTSLVSAREDVFLALNLWGDLIAYLMVRSNSRPYKYFSTHVRELSVFSYGDGQWKNKRSADGAATKDARIARRTNGRNCKMVVVNVEDAFCLD
jgi:hypothetical protein